MTDFVRARRPEQKQQRRETILDAARELAVNEGVRNVSLGAVATAVGLAKSNVVRYFGTREEIYLELAADGWREWRDEVLARLTAGDDVVDTLTDTLQARPLFCDLISHATTSLEHNVSVDAARAYKLCMVSIIGELGDAVAATHPTMTADEGFELVSAATAFAGVVYPASNPPPTLVEVYREHPEIAAVCPSFDGTMRPLLAALVAGLPATRR